MKPHIIAHRANLNGPDPKTENTVEAIKACQMYGIDVELDVWYINGRYYLGHDAPNVEFDLLNFEWQQKRIWQGSDEPRIKAFFHAKTIETLHELLSLQIDMYDHDCFIHDKDEATLTLNRNIWTYPGKRLYNRRSIAVMPEYQPYEYRNYVTKRFLDNTIYGVCTDFPLEWIKLEQEQGHVRR